MVTVEVPSTEVELICSMPLIVFTESSTRLVISVSTSSADAPGLLTETDTVGKSILGSRSTPKVKNEKPPTTISATISMVAKTGRLTQSSASLCTGYSPAPTAAGDEPSASTSSPSYKSCKWLLATTKSDEMPDRIWIMSPSTAPNCTTATRALPSRTKKTCEEFVLESVKTEDRGRKIPVLLPFSRMRAVANMPGFRARSWLANFASTNT